MNRLNRAGASLFLPIALISLFCVPARAGTGQTGVDFLTINPSPKAVAMGESGTALSDDHLSALSLNSAGLARLRYPEAAFVYNQWLEGVSLQNISYAHPTKDWGAFGLSGTWLQVKSIPGYDNSGASAGTTQVRRPLAPQVRLRPGG